MATIKTHFHSDLPESTANDQPPDTRPYLMANDLKRIYKTVFEARAKWRVLGLELDLTPGSLDAIEQRYFDPKDRLYRVVSEWLARGTASWQELVSALWSVPVGETKLAENIQNEFCPQEATNESVYVDELDDELEQFSCDINTAKKKYANLLSSTRESLKRRGIKLLELVAHLLGYRLTKAVLSKENLLLADRQTDLEKAESIDAIFVIISPFWSFLDYEILEDIVMSFGADVDKQKMEKYVSFLKDFLISWMVEPCTVNQLSYSSPDPRAKLHLKIDTDSMSHYRNIKATIARIFEIKVYTLNLCSIKKGCIELEFHFPSFPRINNLVLNIKTELGKMTPRVLKAELKQESNDVLVLVAQNEAEKLHPTQHILHNLDKRYLTLGKDGCYLEGRDYYLANIENRAGSTRYSNYMWGIDTSTDQQFAMKRSKKYSLLSLTSDLEVNSLKNECYMLSKLGNHKNIVHFFGAVANMTEDGVVCRMFMEFPNDGNLEDIMVVDCTTKELEPLPLDQSLYYVEQILQGVHHLHQNNVLHLDIRGVNILVFDGGRTVKLANLSKAVQLSESHVVTDVTGSTPYFAAPEVIRQEQPLFASDIWSVMCVLVELLTAEWPGCHTQFQTPQMIFLVGAYQDSNIELMVPLSEMSLDPEIEEIFRLVFVADATQRPSAIQLLNHPRIAEAAEYVTEFEEFEYPVSQKGSGALSEVLYTSLEYVPY